MRRRVTFSRNLTLSLSRTCRCYCKYCAFATHQAHLYAPDEVETSLDGAARHGHIQEVILQNFVPHQRYYGQEPAEIADAAATDYWRTGVAHGPQLPLPDWACEVTIDDVKRLIAESRRLMPDVGVQVPPNL